MNGNLIERSPGRSPAGSRSPGRSRARRKQPRRRWSFVAAVAVVMAVVALLATAGIKAAGGRSLASQESPLPGHGQAAAGLVTEGEKGYPDTAPILGGAALTMLQNQSKGQMMSFLLETKEGSLIVIDGGRWDDGDYLAKQIRARGGHVAAWLLTHTHTDHVGALLKLLQSQEDGSGPGITVDNFYYNFASPDWYTLHEPEDMGTAHAIIDALSRQPQEKLHTVKRGDVIQVDDVTVTVMNDRYEPDSSHVGANDGNDSGIAYRMVVNGVSILFLGDLGEIGGNLLLEQAGAGALRSDLVQMAHHGQGGVGENVYQAVDPSICLWPTPQWLWDNEGGQFRTPETKEWIKKLDVKKHYCIKDGDQTVR